MLQPRVSRYRRGWWLAVLTALGSWLILACTAPRMPIVWDEGDYLYRADQIVAWFRLIFSGGPQGGLNAFSSAVIREHWLFATWSEGHPAWFAIPIALSKALLSASLQPLTAARLGPITVFSVACGAVAFRLKREYGTIAAIVAPIALLTLPRMFSDAHFAAQDGQLAAWWLLLWVADSSPQRGIRKVLSVGVLLGLTCATKFTGWFAVVPIVAWRLAARDPDGRRELLTVLPVALLTFCAVNPPLWHAPVAGLITHFRLNLGRPDMNAFGAGRASDLPGVWAVTERPALNIHDYLFGSMPYGFRHPYPPWYNTIAWLVLVTPIPTLVLGFIGLRHGFDGLVRSEEAAPSVFISRFSWLPDLRSTGVMLHWATLMVVRALPGAPPHDGVRLFLPAFGFWCVLAGLGAQRVWAAASRADPRSNRRKIIGAVLAASFAVAAIEEARYYPQTLSHYSLLVGGVRGAARMGLEPTYWWDGLDADVLNWLNSHTEPGAAVAFSLISEADVELLRDWGRLKTGVTDPGWGTPFKWYVLQNRPSLLTAADLNLIRSEAPAYVKYPGHHPHGAPADLNVPLILVFSYQQYQSVVTSTSPRPPSASR